MSRAQRSSGTGPRQASTPPFARCGSLKPPLLPASSPPSTSASASLRHIFIDTPGQIEVFTWSASGQIITEMLASSLPTVLVYVVDTPRSASPVTFMSNMLYACSILYKARLPFVLAFNKTDVAPHDFALEWMEDFEAFQVRARVRSGLERRYRRSSILTTPQHLHALTHALHSPPAGSA